MRFWGRTEETVTIIREPIFTYTLLIYYDKKNTFKSHFILKCEVVAVIYLVIMNEKQIMGGKALRAIY